MRRLLVLGAAIAVMVIGIAPVAGAGNDLVCTGAVSSGTYDNVTVPAGESCQLSGSVVVQGDLKAKGAINVIVSGVTIEGNVKIEESTGSLVVFNAGTRVLGNFEAVKNTVDDIVLIGSAVSGGIVVDGNVKIADNTTPTVAANANTFGGDVTIKGNMTIDAVQAFCNEVTGGNVELSENTATGADGYIEFLADCSIFGLPLGGETNGNITVKKNVATSYVALVLSPTPKNVVVSENTTGYLLVGAMEIGGNLTCTKNDPDPSTFDFTSGADLPNTVAGNDKCTD